MAHRPALTHFLAIPLVTPVSRPQLAERLSAFRADVSTPGSFGVPEEAVRPLGTLHLTLGVMSFPKDEGLEQATELLKGLKPREIFSDVLAAGESSVSKEKEKGNVSLEPPLPKPTITLRGLRSMQPPAKATVLYASPDDQHRYLQRFCEQLKARFTSAGLMVQDDRPLLLHATVVNTIYVQKKKSGGGGGQRRGGGAAAAHQRERLTLDASIILDCYEDYTWMQDVALEKLVIYKMGAKKVVVDGVVTDEAYETVAEISL